MKYSIKENRLQELVNNYFNSFEYTIDDLGGDIVVWCWLQPNWFYDINK